MTPNGLPPPPSRGGGRPPVPVRGASSNSGTGTGPPPILLFSQNCIDLMHSALRELVDLSRAKCAVVVDRTGCILAASGDFHPVNPGVMGATAAATIAALNSLVSRASSQEVSVKFYGGEIDRIHFVLIEERLVLCLLHSRQATSGQIRSASKAFLNRVLPAIEDEKRNMNTEDTDNLLNAVFFIESKLDELFDDPTATR